MLTLLKDLGKCTSVITHLESYDCCELQHFLDPSSSDFLSRLRVLEVTKKVFRYNDTFTSFCKCLMVNTTVVDFIISIGSLWSAEAAPLAEVFSLNKTLRTICLKSSNIQDRESLILFTAISNNSVISKIDLTNLGLQSSNVLLPLLKRSTLRSVMFPLNCRLDSTIINGLRVNSNIQEVVIPFCNFDSQDLADVLKFNTF
ncbi:hypothetical protein GEMRC1_000253 [Eukaryota sp. GEM-RC1]